MYTEWSKKVRTKYILWASRFAGDAWVGGPAYRQHATMAMNEWFGHMRGSLPYYHVFTSQIPFSGSYTNVFGTWIRRHADTICHGNGQYVTEPRLITSDLEACSCITWFEARSWHVGHGSFSTCILSVIPMESCRESSGSSAHWSSGQVQSSITSSVGLPTH